VKEQFPVCNASDLKEMEPVSIEHRGVPYCVIKSEKALHAFVAVCSHKDLPMFPPDCRKGQLICPHHKVSFDPLTGDVARAHGKSVPRGLMPVEIEIREGVVLLEARGKHRKMLSKKQRHKVEKRNQKLAKKHGKAV
jgi:nitrite reductase/ring-hydroxylating ferredoxin subunit